MTAKELADMLSGREYGMEISNGEARDAKDSGLAVVYGYSDDNVEFDGAIREEVGAYNGTTIYVGKDGLIDDPDCTDADHCPYFEAAKKAAKKIEAVWGKGGVAWTFETDIPHETFNIYEDGELFCVGIVFSMEYLGRGTDEKNLEICPKCMSPDCYNCFHAAKREELEPCKSCAKAYSDSEGQSLPGYTMANFCSHCGRRLDGKWSFYDGEPSIGGERPITPTPNDPLTLEELREMDGEPVWLVFTPDADEESLAMWALVSVDAENDEIFLLNSIGGSSAYEEVWADVKAIYRRKPGKIISMTRADQIRAMSDEELAAFLDHVHHDPCHACCGNLSWCRRNNAPEPDCKRHNLIWLKERHVEEGSKY